MTAHAAAKGEPTSVYAKSHDDAAYYYYYIIIIIYNSFFSTKNHQRSEKNRSTALKVELAKC